MAHKVVKLKLDEFLKNIDFFVNEAKKWKIFIYPTDTIYWIWGVFPDTLEKIYKIKQRPYSKKVSIIWPYEGSNLVESLPIKISEEYKKQLNDLLTDIRKRWRWWTVIWKMEQQLYKLINENLLSKQIYQDKTIWIRILNHPFQKFVNKLSLPFITTSANISGEEVIKQIKDLPNLIKSWVDWIIDWGVLDWKPSILIYTIDGIKVVER